MAELYRFVTGGRPCKYILVISPAVCMRNANRSRIKAVFPSVFGHFSQETRAKSSTTRYNTIACRNG